jgi:hypothetical protein
MHFNTSRSYPIDLRSVRADQKKGCRAFSGANTPQRESRAEMVESKRRLKSLRANDGSAGGTRHALRFGGARCVAEQQFDKRDFTAIPGCVSRGWRTDRKP